MGAFDLKIRFEISDKVTARLQALPRRIQNRVNKEGLTEVGKLLAGDMAARAPVSNDQRLVSGLLKQAIGAKTKTYRRGIVVLIVGPRKGFRTNKKTGLKKRTRFARVVGFGAGGEEKLQIPSQYAHLAGKGRKATFGRDAARAGKAIASSVLEGKLRQALAERGG